MKHPLYHIYHNMKQRCLNPNRHDYKYYGGRGIKICEEWLISIDNFINEMYPSFIEGMTLDRINVNGNYSKQNCKWIEFKYQAQNKRIYERAHSDVSGVSKHGDRWRARYHRNNKSISLGIYDTIEEAKQAILNYINKE